MKKQTFVIAGIVSLILVSFGFIAVFFKKGFISPLLIAAGGICFWLILRKAKKEYWFGKPVK